MQKVLVHSPDSGLGKVVPSKAQDWLFEDIVHLETIRKKEYDFYTKILLYFLDPDKVKNKLAQIDSVEKKRVFYKPHDAGFHKSKFVVEFEWLLADILKIPEVKQNLLSSVCALESVPYKLQYKLESQTAENLAKLFICGAYGKNEMLFPPIPNLIFTRDLGIVINDYILLNKPAKKARSRESLLTKYIFFNHPMFAHLSENILELPDTHYHFLNPREGDEKKVSLEGGDVMVVSPKHLLIGISERTSWEGAHQAIKLLFEKQVVDKISVLRIPKKRDYMHIDTIFTQVSRDTWVMLGLFSKNALRSSQSDPIEMILEGGGKRDEKIQIIQFLRNDPENPKSLDSLEQLLKEISRKDLNVKGKVHFIYSGNNQFPYDVREQWTDSCNLLALREGVVLGYDRNNKTIEAFEESGFVSIDACELLENLENGKTKIPALEKLFIKMPSAELSRARGGFHCMSMPLFRKPLAL